MKNSIFKQHPMSVKVAVSLCPCCGQPRNTRNDASKYFKKEDGKDAEGIV